MDMSLPSKHNTETKILLKKISTSKISEWLLMQGYYPEQYVVTPTFKVEKFDLQKRPYFEVTADSNGQPKFNPTKSDLINVSFPKTKFTDRTFSIIEPRIYHDLVWYLVEEWKLVIKSLFKKENKIYSYSFPIPLSKNNLGNISNLRSGRMIYEYIEMAENDLVAEACNYKYIIKTDIKNFYPSIYTHSIAWALHTKKTIRTKGNRNDYLNFLGLKIDKLIQYSNDGCTNGIAIGPAISDLIAEIVLTTVDTESSKVLDENGIDFIGVRFKDDYKFLCQSKSDANLIIKTLQKQMSNFNLTLSESKTKIDELPEGLFREWTADYVNVSLRKNKSITYKEFESSLRLTLEIDKKFEGTGVIDRFLSELITNEGELKLNFKGKDLLKAISLMLLLKEKRNKSLPQVLGIIENIIQKNEKEKEFLEKVTSIIREILNNKLEKIEENEYDLIWLIYFIKSQNLFPVVLPPKVNSLLIKSLKNNNLQFFKVLPDGIKLYRTIKKTKKNTSLIKYLSLFKRDDS
jgi:hypothetical protein